MCFLYRQSISIVYESKFKYIYRYFIKIDRCFCGILQSLPLRKCGLKSSKILSNSPGYRSLPLRKCGLKLVSAPPASASFMSLPLRKCGLKSLIGYHCRQSRMSLPLRKCGLKSHSCQRIIACRCHFPCGSVD